MWRKWAKTVDTKLDNKKHTILRPTNEVDKAIRIFNHILTSEAANHLGRKENIPPITLAIRDDHKIHILKANKRKERAIYNTDPHKDKTNHNTTIKKLEDRKKNIIVEKVAEQWEKTRKKIEKDPSHIYKMLKNTGKKAKKNKTTVVMDHQRKLTANLNTVKEEFKRQWSGVFTSKGPRPAVANTLCSSKILNCRIVKLF